MHHPSFGNGSPRRRLALPALLVGVTAGAVACTAPTSGPETLTSGIAGSSALSGAPVATLYVAPGGSGTACSEAAPCDLLDAQQVVRSINGAMQGDIYVYLHGGTYTLGAPLELGPADSGTNGHTVAWMAYPNEAPALSGGRVVTTPWAVKDPAKNIWSTTLPAPLQSRQLYVNGLRATRARGPEKPAGYALTATGFKAPDTTMSTWANPTGIELVWFGSWRAFRCDVSSIAGRDINLQAPCFKGSRPPKIALEWIENARELLDEEGEFYLDSVTGELDYIPRQGESMATANVVVPVLETLVEGNGALGDPVHNIQLSNITFEHATWLAPNLPTGYQSMQAGMTNTGQTPGNVTFSYAESITITGCTFTHLGAAALSFGTGSQNNVIVTSTMSDVSGAGISLGNTTAADAHPADPRSIVSGNLIQDNFITHVGAEYLDSVGIFAGYVSSTTITHNELFALPYTGISVGWGWGIVDGTAAAAGANTITWNEISYHMRTLHDGGAIYTLGPQPGSMIKFNYAHDQGSDIGGALYLDNGTQGYTVEANVAVHNPFWTLVQAGHPLALHNVVVGNYHDAEPMWSAEGPPDPSNQVGNNPLLPKGVWPALATTVLTNAGLEAPYRYLHPKNLALGQPASASSWKKPGTAFVPNAANDGIATNGWSAATTDLQPWWQVDLGGAHVLHGIEIPTRWGVDEPETRQNFEVLGSNDPSFATFTLLASQGAPYVRSQDVWTAPVTDPNTYRYVRVAKTAPSYFYLAEVHVLGD